MIWYEYFVVVWLYIICEDLGIIVVFMGLSNDCIEMLFVCLNVYGYGYGSWLVEFVIWKKWIYKVDVNE